MSQRQNLKKSSGGARNNYLGPPACKGVGRVDAERESLRRKGKTHLSRKGRKSKAAKPKHGLTGRNKAPSTKFYEKGVRQRCEVQKVGSWRGGQALGKGETSKLCGRPSEPLLRKNGIR